MKQLQAFEVPLNKIFCSDYDFKIPDYQRPYAWGTDEARQLLDDLTYGLETTADEPYFLGSIVLVKDPSTISAEVIDGQQRLTTLTILLAVLRDLCIDAEYRSSLDSRISEPGDPVTGLTAKPRLTLRYRDRDFFYSYVQSIGGIGKLIDVKDDALATEAQRNIRDNSKLLHDELQTWSQEGRETFARMLMGQTFLVAVSTPDLDSAHRIFSVMNSRGLDLSPSDIFKAEVVGEFESEESTKYADKWENAEEAVGRDVFVDLFLHIRLIHSLKRSEQSLLKEFPTQVLAQYLPGRAKEFVDDVLEPYASAYVQLNSFSYAAAEGAEKVNAWFKRLAQLDTNDWQAPALWALRHHGDDPEWLNAFFQRLDRLASSMFIRREYVTPRLLRYLDLLRQLSEGHGLNASAFELDNEEQQNTLDRLNGDVYSTSKTRKFVLLRLDEILAKNPGVTYERRIVTVEHVLPQNPKRESVWSKTFTDEQRAEWTHRIANLVLLNQVKNSEAQNFDFAEKKSKYFWGSKGAATFALTSQVLNHEEWTPSVLESRQTELVAELAAAWSLA